MIWLINLYYKVRFYIYSLINYKMNYEQNYMYDLYSEYDLTYAWGTEYNASMTSDNIMFGYPHAELPNYEYRINGSNVELKNNIYLTVSHNKDYTDKKRYNAGAIHSQRGYKYALFNYLAMLPRTRGVWSGLWTFGVNGLPEVDFEHCGEWRRKVAATFHWGYKYEPNCKKQTRNNIIQGAKYFKPRSRYYMYSIEMTPYDVNWYINGIKVKTMDFGVDNDQRFMATCVVGDYCYSFPCVGELPDQLVIKELTVMEKNHEND